MSRITRKTRQPTIGRIARAKRGKERNTRTAPKGGSAGVPDDPDPPALHEAHEDHEGPSESKSERADGTRNSHDLYMRDIGEAGDLLDAEEEISLAKEMLDRVIAHTLQRLDSAERIRRSRKTPARKRAAAEAYIEGYNRKGLKQASALRRHLTDLFLKDEEGRKAYAYFLQHLPQVRKRRDRYAEANLRLVMTVAKRFRHERLTFMDLVQEGNMGLLTAIARFDYRRGYRFSTFAVWWIRHAISRAIADTGREIRVPVHMIESYGRLTKAERELTSSLGRKPTPEETASVTGMQPNQAEKTRKAFLNPLSLDAHARDDDGEGDDLHEVLTVPPEGPDALEGAESAELARLVARLLADERILSPIEQDVLRRRFGLVPGNGRYQEEETFAVIGSTYRLSRERIRQIQNGAFAKLRKAMARHLRDAA